MQAFSKPQVEQLESRNLPSGLTYYGGPVLDHVQVEAIFYGTYWTSSAGSSRATQLEAAITDLIGGSYMDPLMALQKIDSTSPQIGRGNLDHVDVVNDDSWISSAGKISANDVVTIIKNEVNSGNLPTPGKETLYLFFGPMGVNLGGGEFHSDLTVGGKTPPTLRFRSTTPMAFLPHPFKAKLGALRMKLWKQPQTRILLLAGASITWQSLKTKSVTLLKRLIQ